MNSREYIKQGLRKFKASSQLTGSELRNAMIKEAKRLESETQTKEEAKQKDEGLTFKKAVRAYFPRTMQAAEAGHPLPVASGIHDVMSIIPRTIEGTIAAYNPLRDDDVNTWERMAQTETGEIGSDIVRAPENIMMGTGGLITKAGQPIVQKALSYFGQAAGQQLPFALLEQAKKMETEDKGFDLGEVAKETVIGGALPVAAKAVTKTVLKPAKNFAKELIAESSNRSKELLQTIGLREAKQTLKSAFSKNVKPDEVLKKYSSFAENAEQAADNIIKAVDDLDVKFLEKNKIVDRSISNMPDMDAAPFLNKLQSTKKIIPDNSVGYEDDILLNRKIDGLMNRVKQRIDARNSKNIATGLPQGTKITARDMLEIRRDIDKTIDWNANEFSKAYYNPIMKLKKDARTFVKNDLEKNAELMGDKEYKEAMKYFGLLDMQEKAKKLVTETGKDFGDIDKSQRFLMQLSNPNQLDKRKWAKEFERATGYDLLADADLLRMSKEYRGALPMINDYRTGAKSYAVNLTQNVPVVGSAVGAALSSPKAGAAMYGMMDEASQFGQTYSPMLRKLMRPAVTQQVGE